MTGRLRAIGRILAAYTNDLYDSNATPEEREVASVLSAVCAAILLDDTGSLAGAVAPWWDGQAVEAVKAIAEQRRED